MSAKRSTNETLVKALCILARDIQSNDGVANLVMQEAADRIEELVRALELSGRECERLHHAEGHRHKSGEPCPVEAVIERALE